MPKYSVLYLNGVRSSKNHFVSNAGFGLANGISPGAIAYLVNQFVQPRHVTQYVSDTSNGR